MSNEEFRAWAKETVKNHGETLEVMKNSLDVLDRVIAKRIIKAATQEEEREQ